MVLDSQLEQILNNSLQGGAGGLEPTLVDSVIRQVMDGSKKLEAEGRTPVLLVSSGLRAFLSRLLRGRMENFYILAYEEIPPNKSIRVVATIGSAAPAATATAEGGQ